MKTGEQNNRGKTLPSPAVCFEQRAKVNCGAHGNGNNDCVWDNFRLGMVSASHLYESVLSNNLFQRTLTAPIQIVAAIYFLQKGNLESK